MLESAGTMEELSASLAEELKVHGLVDEYAGEIAKALVTDCATFYVPTPRPGTLSLLIGRYAIRKDDIKLFDLLTDGLKAAAAVNFFASHQPVLSANVGIAVSLAKLVRGLLMRGGVLDRDSIHVLTVLKCNATVPGDPGLSPEEVLQVIHRTKPEHNIAWVNQKLGYLKEVPMRDGSRVVLASPDSLGRWRSHA